MFLIIFHNKQIKMENEKRKDEMNKKNKKNEEDFENDDGDDAEDEENEIEGEDEAEADGDDAEDGEIDIDPDQSEDNDTENIMRQYQDEEVSNSLNNQTEKSTMNSTKYQLGSNSIDTTIRESNNANTNNINNTLTQSVLNDDHPYIKILTSKNDLQTKNYSRDELVFLTKIYERAELYEESVESSYLFIKMKPILSSEERVVFSNAFKNLLLLKRASLKSLEEQYKKEKRGKNHFNITSLLDIINKVEDELNILIGLMLEIVDDMLLPNSKKAEALVFYIKLKADYYRYKAEISKGSEREISIDLSEQAYNEAYMMAEEQLPITSIVRIGLALNFSIFYYEHKGLLDEAIMIARSCFDDAIKVVDEVEADKSKDYILIVQLLKENVIFWNTEKAEEEASQN